MKPILGSHVGMRKPDGYLKGSVLEAINDGANTFMIFTGPPQSTFRTKTDQLNIDEMKKLCIDANIDLKNLVVHAPYLINISNSVKLETWEFGVDFLRKEIQRCEDIGINILVLHPGSFGQKGDYKQGLDMLIRGLDAVADAQTNVIIALETMAGKGTEVGTKLEDFKYVLDNVNNPNKIGICIDTCHMHDAGYDFDDWNAIKNNINQTVGKDKIVCFHLNDSKNELNAHKDRHENIGYGYIGFNSLLQVLWDEEYMNIPKILETPYNNGVSPYKIEINDLLNKEFSNKIK